MRKIPKGRGLLAGLTAAMALVALTVVPVLAQIPVFSPFSGDLIIDDEDAPVESQVRAYVDGEPADLLEPAVDDVFTVTTAGEYEILIFTDATGQAVTFEVKKAGTTDWLAADSDPANPVTSLQPQFVDLEATSGAQVPPTVVTTTATNIGTTTATTGGDLTDMGTASTVACYIELGTTTLYGSTCGPVNKNSTGTFSCNWSSLMPDTTYYFRAKAVGHGDPVYGDDMTFKTAKEAGPPGETFADWLYNRFIA